MIYSRLPPNAPSPRICIVRKKEEHMEYGFNLHAERGKGQFVGAVDAGSPAEQAGLRLGDRIFAVNGELIAGSTHKEVVRRIKSNPLRCELLVISEEGARLYAKHGILIDHSLPNIVQKFEMDSDREDYDATRHNVAIVILMSAAEIRAPAGGRRRLFFNPASNRQIVEDVNGDEDFCSEASIPRPLTSGPRTEHPLINHDAMNTELERYAVNEELQHKKFLVDYCVAAGELNEIVEQTYITTLDGSYSIASKISALGVHGDESNTHQHHYEANFHEQGEEQQEEPPIPFSSSSSSLSATSVNSNNCHSNLHHLYWSNNNTATSKFLSNASAPRTQIAYPPPTAATATFAGMMAALRPRLCRLIKHSPADEFGFNLHAERGKGHFIGAVDKNGIADRAGLETGQRIVGVNGQLIFPNTAHKEVVALIKRDPLTTELLVASEEVDRWHSENSASFSYDSVIVYEPLLPSSSSSASPAICSGHNHHHTPSTNHQRNGSYEGASGRAIRSRVGSSSSAKIESEAERLHNNDYQNIQNNVSLSSVDTFGRPQQLVTTTFTKHVIASGGAVISNNNQCTAVSNLRPGSFDSGVVPLSAKPVPLMVPPPSKGNNPSSASVFKDENLNNTSYYSNGSNGNVMENNGGGYSVGAAGTSPIGYGNIDDGLKSSDIFKLNAKEARQAMRHRKRDPRQSNNMSLEEKYKVIANL